MQNHIIYDVIIAWAQGKKIEVKRKLGHGPQWRWSDWEEWDVDFSVTPEWHNPSYEWRIQPEKFFWVFYENNDIAHESPMLYPEKLTKIRAASYANRLGYERFYTIDTLEPFDPSDFGDDETE